MARKQKDTVSYFPHDANASSGDTLTILQGRFGNDGYAFWFKLLEKLSSTEGHHLDLKNPTKWNLFAAKMGVAGNVCVEMCNLLVEMEAIDAQLWEERVIWCQNLVNNLADVYRNRRRRLPEKPITTVKKVITTGRNAITTPESTQSKVKYSKVDNSIITPEKKGWGEFQNVLLTEAEYQKLHDRFNKETSALIERLSTYIASTGKRYKSHYATLLSWKQRDDKEGKSGKTGHWPRELPTKYTEPPDYGDD